MRWVLLLAACSPYSSYQAAQAGAAIGLAVAAGAARASWSSGARSRDRGDTRGRGYVWPSSGVIAQERHCASDGASCVYARECRNQRGYYMMLPHHAGPWSCYLENSDGHRYDCAADGSVRIPPELDRWCAN